MFRLLISAASAAVIAIALHGGGAQAQFKAGDHVTPGGIPFRHVPMPRSRSQVIQFGWRDGYAFSLKEGQAAGSWAAGTIMQGPEGSSRGEFDEDAKDAQARMSLQSGFHATLGSIWAPPDKMDDAVALFSRTLANPALDPERLKERIAHRKQLIKQARVKAETLAGDIASHLFFPPGPIRQWRIGDDDLLDAVTVARIDEWRKAVLTRGGVTVASAGPEPVGKVAEQIDRLLGSLPEKGAEARRHDFPILSSTKTVALAAPVPQTYLMIGGWSGIARSEDPFITDILTAILRGRLFKAVREKLGAAYGARAQLSSQGPDRLFFSINAAVEHEKAPDALAAMRAELSRFLADGITQAEFEPQKEKLLSETRQSMRKAPYVARLLRNAMLDGLPANHVEAYDQRIANVTLDHANRIIREKLGGQPFATIIIAPDTAAFRADCAAKAPQDAEACR